MTATIVLHVDAPAHAKEAREATNQERQEWVERLQRHIQTHDERGYSEAEFVTPDGLLHLNATRHGTAVSAVWGAGPPPGVAVAASLFLRGVSGQDDEAALTTFGAGQFVPVQRLTQIKAQNRPCVNIVWADRHWFENGHIIVAAMALASGLMVKPGGKAGFEPVMQSTPEEIAAQRKEVDAIGRVFGILQTDLAGRGKLRYTVRPAEKVRGRPVDEIMDVKFWVGTSGKGETLSLVGLVNVFLMLKDYVEQSPGMKYLKTPTTRHRIDFGLAPSMISSALKQITISEPGQDDSAL